MSGHFSLVSRNHVSIDGRADAAKASIENTFISVSENTLRIYSSVSPTKKRSVGVPLPFPSQDIPVEICLLKQK